MGRRTRLYMAYGSNMNLEQMADRCRTAEVVGKGILKNYELLFRGEALDEEGRFDHDGATSSVLYAGLFAFGGY